MAATLFEMPAPYIVPEGDPRRADRLNRYAMEREHPEGVLYCFTCERCAVRFTAQWSAHENFDGRWTVCSLCWNTMLAFQRLAKRFRKRMRGKKP